MVLPHMGKLSLRKECLSPVAQSVNVNNLILFLVDQRKSVSTGYLEERDSTSIHGELSASASTVMMSMDQIDLISVKNAAVLDLNGLHTAHSKGLRLKTMWVLNKTLKATV